MRLAIALLCAVSCGGCFSVAAPQKKEPSAAERMVSVYRSVVTVHKGEKVVCAGVLRDGLILTAAHCVDTTGADKFSTFEDYRQGTGVVYPFNVVFLDTKTDAAILSVSAIVTQKVTSAPLGDSMALLPGAEVATVGHPIGLAYSFSLGYVSTRRRSFDGKAYLQASINVTSGNSGGPLFNRKGEVVGIMASGLQSWRRESFLSFFVPIEVYKKELGDK